MQSQKLNESLLSEKETHEQTAEALLKEKYLSRNIYVNGSSWFQKIFFTWVQPLLSFGSKHTISLDLMPQLPSKFSTENEFQQFNKVWVDTKKCKSEGWTLIKALVRMHLKEWIVLLLTVLGTVFFWLATPLLTALNIRYISTYRDNIEMGVGLFFLTFFVTFLHRITQYQCDYGFRTFGIRLSNVVTMLIYNKSLKYSPLSEKTFTQAEIINYSQVDAQRLMGLGNQVTTLFHAPLIIVVGIVAMYMVLGWTFLTSIGFMVLIMVTSYFITKVNKKLNDKTMKAKDKRMKATEEMLDIIRFIKISAIEKFFYRKVDEKREAEIKIEVRKTLNIILIICQFWITGPILLSACFFTYIYFGNQISSEVAFTTMAIIRLFEGPLFGLPNAVNDLLQTFTSLKRIEKYLFAKEIDGGHIGHGCQRKDNAIQIKMGNFYWKREEKKEEDQDQDEKKSGKEKKDDRRKLSADDLDSKGSKTESTLDNESDESKEESTNFTERDEEGKPLYIHALKDINTEIKKGKLTMIVGDIGSGKTSLLLAIINEMLVGEGSRINVSGSIAYSPQKPWIMSKTLQENITFLSEADEERVKKVVHYACLEDDLKMLPKGLETEIGEKGINISGGQKARVELGRSLYSNKDILLLDDILSAVDVHVGEFIIKETIRKFLIGKTVIMPTHAIKFASYADELIIMKKGKIVKKGSYKNICKSAQFQEVSVKEHEGEESESEKDKEDEKDVETEMAQIRDALKMKEKKEGEKNQKEEVNVNNSLVEELMLPEDHKVGEVDFKVFLKFIELNGGFLKYGIALIIFMLGITIFDTGADLIIQYWCQNPEQGETILYVFVGSNIIKIGFLSMACYATLIIGLKKQSRIVHREMIKRLLYASLSNFFNRVPTGRIVNRLTKDLRELDQSIMHCFLWFMVSAFQLSGSLGVCIYTTTPLIIIPMIVVGYLANRVRNYYMKTQRESTRFEKSTNSPVVSGFLAVISGLPTIRAYHKEQQFSAQQFKDFDANKKVRFTRAGLQNWFRTVLSMLGFLISMPCIAYSLFFSNGNESTVGLLMNYALFITFQINGLIQCEAGFESQLITMERLYKFMEIQPENGYVQYCKNWIPEEDVLDDIFNEGEIKFEELKVRYRKDLPDVIKGIQCKVKGGEKIGIVGRTGAGKTTIINTLLGVTEMSSGGISIDGISLQQLPLKALRQSVTMIDQDPTLIKSTFKENLDMTGRYSDEELEKILKECNLWEIIEEKGGLDAAVSNTSLSAGEKQLLCICRAFLKQSKVVLIDEATANIDVKNDALIQKVIAEKFKDSTVLTIAHRLSTLQNSSKIMVMEQGKLVEFGSPSDLENKSGGIYSEMMKKNQQEMLK